MPKYGESLPYLYNWFRHLQMEVTDFEIAMECTFAAHERAPPYQARVGATQSSTRSRSGPGQSFLEIVDVSISVQG